MLTIKQLQYLDSIYKNKSFTKAAHELFVSQPAISNAVNSIENELGFRIIARNTKELTFTPEGKRYMEYVEKILMQCVEADNYADRITKSENNKLRLGVSKSAGIEIVRMIYNDFAQRWPDADIMVDDEKHDALLGKLLDGSLDLYYSTYVTPYNNLQISTDSFVRNEVKVLLSKEHPLAKKEKLTTADIDKMPSLVIDKDSFHDSYTLNELKFRNCFPKVSSCFGQIINMYELCERNNYIGLISTTVRSAISFGFQNTLTLRELGDPPILHYGGYYYSKSGDLSAIAKDLIEFTKAEFADKK